MQVALDSEDIERIASRVVELLREQREDSTPGGWLAPEAAARYLGISRKRVYDLKSMRAIEPDGYDGRVPLFKRQTLDAYAISNLPEGSSPRVAP